MWSFARSGASAADLVDNRPWKQTGVAGRVEDREGVRGGLSFVTVRISYSVGPVRKDLHRSSFVELPADIQVNDVCKLPDAFVEMRDRRI